MSVQITVEEAVKREFKDITGAWPKESLRFAINQLERSRKPYAILPMGQHEHSRVKILSAYHGEELVMSLAALAAIAAMRNGYTEASPVEP